MKQIIMSLVYGFIVFASTQTYAKNVDIVDGKIAFQTCRGCHSTPNSSSVYPTYYVPKVGGQRPSYTVSALNAYKNEARARTSMLANAISLSDDTIANIAAYIEVSAGKALTAPFTGDPKNGETLAQSCLGCHTNDLKDGMTAPILAGQYGNYLVRAMKDYQSGKRTDAMMQGMVAGLTEDELADIASYFADMKGLSIVR